MSKYTTEVRYLCESAVGLEESVGYNSIDTVLTQAAPLIFSFNFPIFDELYRLPLEKKILKHYYTREISEETYGLWKLRLDAKMNEIMPYFNQLYTSELLEFNPLYDFDYTKEGRRDGERTDTGTITDTNEKHISDAASGAEYGSDHSTDEGESTVGHDSNEWNLYNDTPQGGTIGIAMAASTDPSLNSGGYLTNARRINTNGNDLESHENAVDGTHSSQWNSTRTYGDTADNVNERDLAVSSTDEYFERVSGKMPGKSYPQMIRELRENMLNIDMMVIDALSDLFFGLWD